MGAFTIEADHIQCLAERKTSVIVQRNVPDTIRSDGRSPQKKDRLKKGRLPRPIHPGEDRQRSQGKLLIKEPFEPLNSHPAYH
jgi:hypothetical protein